MTSNTPSTSKYWLMKCEPGAYSIDDLARDKRAGWEGVRNYQARNFLRDSIKIGDRILYYHSNAEPSGIVGTARVVKAGYPDPFAQKEGHKYYDPKSTPDNPIWYTVDIEFESKFKTLISLEMLRNVPELANMMVLK
ncbi:EVE domain-containing protein, partial [bacterium]|nr:EVE domain-containing protein [bacterium]